ncbi:MAG TPA: exopolysaccharide biosynthesis polyprenyl glycosylphosphotransferase, partial [Deinococcales bacterium]|nr:exopolysaccharide biosynthesis polyprenyl glycosylphosphotransferase [Deinococcales bacterium]
VIGTGTAARRLARQLLEEPKHGFQPVAMLDPTSDVDGSTGELPVFNSVAAASSANALACVMAMPEATRETIGGLLDDVLTRFNRVVIAQDLLEAQSLGVTALSFGDSLAFDVRRTLSSRIARTFKRAFDLACITLAAPVWVPVVLVTALLTWLEDRHSPFYRQERVGAGGRVFRVWKLRTMVPNAEAALRAHLERDAAARAEWERNFKLKRDPRITKFGRFFRKVSLDELPQLFNVVVGEMSLVGPRPLPAYHHDALPARAAELRTRSLPGLTGMWQVEGRSDTDLQGMAVLDTRYIRNWSFWLDLVILARTVMVVLRGKGAY